jgi:hypothetical protein
MAFGVHGLAVKHAGLAHRKISDVDHLLDLAVAFGLDFAHFQGNEAAKRVLIFPQRIADAAHGLAT